MTACACRSSLAFARGRPILSAAARGVCQDEEASALMRRADFSRREHARPNAVTHIFQVSSDALKSTSNMPRDVFEEDEFRFDLTDDSRDFGP